jgi:hypothetical protein
MVNGWVCRMTFDAVLWFVGVGTLMWIISSEIHPAIGSIALVSAFLLGAARRSLGTALIVAIAATTLNLGLLFSRGMPFRQDAWLAVAGPLLALLAIICGGGWMLGRLSYRLIAKAMPTQTQ